MTKLFRRLVLSSVLSLYLLTPTHAAQSSEGEGGPIHHLVAASEMPADNGKILVEIFLAPEQKGNIEAIKKEFAVFGITKVKTQVFRLGHPPENIAIGRNVPADVARMAIRLAVTYNRGIHLILPEERLAPDYLALGTSIFDESFQIPIHPEELNRLSDPKLTTAEFHALYQKIAKDNKQPYSRP